MFLLFSNENRSSFPTYMHKSMPWLSLYLPVYMTFLSNCFKGDILAFFILWVKLFWKETSFDSLVNAELPNLKKELKGDHFKLNNKNPIWARWSKKW